MGAGVVGDRPSGDGKAIPGQPEAAGSFKFSNRVFSDQAHAERVFSTTDSNLRATQKRLVEAETAARNAVGLAERLIAERAGGGQQVAAPPQPVAPATPETPWYEDGEFLDFYKDLLEQQGPDVAVMHLLSKVDSVVNDRVQKAREEWEKQQNERYAPLMQAHQVGQMYQGAMGVFYGVAEEADGGGRPLYPELAQNEDPDVHREIVKLWREIDPKVSLGARGVRQAVFEYRSGYRAGGERVDPSTMAPSFAPSAGGAPSAAGVVRNIQARDDAGAEVLTGIGTPRPAAPGSDTPEARLKTALRRAGSTVKQKDGFDMGFSAD